jgi:uncharacterized phage protein gp47/JayE
MPWPVPQPGVIASRAAAVYAGLYTGFNPAAANTVAGANCRIVAMSAFDLYGYQGYIAGELFVDTSQDNLDRHAAIWGLTRIPAQAASGPASAAGANGTAIPAGTVATDPFGNAFFVTVAGAVAGDTAGVTIAAVGAGAQGNLAAGTVLTLVSPIGGLLPQSLTVLSPGLSGGGPAESDAALRSRVIARIRQRGRGGNVADYTQWAEAASGAVAYVQVCANYYGLGSVALFVAGAGPAALTGAEIAAVDAYVQGVRPVTAQVTTAAATVATVNGTVHLVPDTAANRLAAANGFASWLVTAAAIGGTCYVADMASAIKGALGGEASFDISAPAADVICAPGTICAPGVLSFV